MFDPTLSSATPTDRCPSPPISCRSPRPVPHAATGPCILDWGDHGAKCALQFFNDAIPGNNPLCRATPTHGFLMRRGYIVGWPAWEGGPLPDRGQMTGGLPVTHGQDRPITDPARVAYIVDRPDVTTLPPSSRLAARSSARLSGGAAQEEDLGIARQ